MLLVLLAGCNDSTPVGDTGPDLDAAPAADLAGGEAPAAREASVADRGAKGAERVLAGCPSFDAPAALGNLESALIGEGSGLLASRSSVDVFFAHNDSGDTARFFAFNRQGKHLGTFSLQGVTAVDWEDMAGGPGPLAGKQYLYFGDIGDNGASRATIAVYRVVEPTVSATQAPVTVTLTGVEKLTLKYPDGAHNSETLLVDPQSGDLFVVVKSSDGASPVFSSPTPQDPSGTRTLSKVATLTFGSGALASTGTLTTGGDISPDGQEILIRTYGAAVLWQRATGATVAAALGGTPCLLKVASEPQGEAISFDDKKGFYTISEGSHPPLYHYARR